VVVGCRQEMADQGRLKPLEPSPVFADGRSARAPVEGTVARGELRAEEGLFTGTVGKTTLTTLPVPLTPQLLQRGQERFNVFCAPCHDRLGTGEGMVVRRGLRRPPSYHIDRLREAPLGYYVDTMAKGFGAMPDYATQIPPADRWAIAAYIRALQLSQHATIDEVPLDQRHELDKKDDEEAGGTGSTPHD
jgi:mono/diheme cytochrome c family protein